MPQHTYDQSDFLPPGGGYGAGGGGYSGGGGYGGGGYNNGRLVVLMINGVPIQNYNIITKQLTASCKDESFV